MNIRRFYFLYTAISCVEFFLCMRFLWTTAGGPLAFVITYAACMWVAARWEPPPVATWEYIYKYRWNGSMMEFLGLYLGNVNDPNYMECDCMKGLITIKWDEVPTTPVDRL